MRSESLMNAAFRELEEETGLKPNDMVLIARFETLSVEHFIYVADFEKDYFAPMALSEITECRWCRNYSETLILTVDSKLILSTFRDAIRSI